MPACHAVHVSIEVTCPQKIHHSASLYRSPFSGEVQLMSATG
jgi:hypothetical protein